MEPSLVIAGAIAVFVIIAFAKTITIVPNRNAYVVERLGKYHKTLNAGLHILVPFIDAIRYKHNLKEVAMDVPEQHCISKDNIQMTVDGVLYIQVQDPQNASYGTEDYVYSSTQLAQTTLRSIIGKIDLDKTFEEREQINKEVVAALDDAASPWGVKILRYEIANIELPETIKGALETQMRAERERRAVVAKSEGQKQALINTSEGEKEEMINLSEARKQAQENDAAGKAKEIELIANATAAGIRKIAEAVQEPGGNEAVSLRLGEQYIEQFGHIAKESTTVLLPSQLSDIGGAVAGLTTMMGTMNPAANNSK